MVEPRKRSGLERGTQLQRGTALRRRPIQPKRWLPVSPAQRVKVIESPCLVCGRVPVDAAHLVPRRLGGCQAPACVIPLCRTHHRLFDSGRLCLAPYLGPENQPELSHALTHVSAGRLRAALLDGWPTPWESER